MQTLDEAKAKLFGLPANLHGVVVSEVAPDSPLAGKIRPLDVIDSINGRGIANADDAAKALSRLKTKEDLVLSYYRVVKGIIERRTESVP